MSYILDALRKSDQQRRLGGVPTLAYAQTAPIAPERSVILQKGVSGLILIFAIGMLIAWLRPPPPEPAAITTIAAIAAKPPASPPLQAVLPLAAPAQPEPAPAEALASAAPVPALAVPAPRRKPPVTARSETRNMPPVAVAASPAGADAALPRKPMASSDLPSSIRKTLPVMLVAVHAYSATAEDSLVSINGRMLREGDTLAPDLKLEQITPDGMIFTYRGYRFRRGAQ